MWKKFIAWLKKSGITYSYGKYKNQEMIDSLNPFDFFNEEYCFFERKNNMWIDTIPHTIFNIVTGDHYDLRQNGYGRIGILDILVFPLISRRLIAYTHNPNNNIMFRGLSALPGYILEFTRITLATILTICITPIASPIKYLYEKITSSNKSEILNTPKARPEAPHPTSSLNSQHVITSQLTKNKNIGSHKQKRETNETQKLFPINLNTTGLDKFKITLQQLGVPITNFIYENNKLYINIENTPLSIDFEENRYPGDDNHFYDLKYKDIVICSTNHKTAPHDSYMITHINIDTLNTLLYKNNQHKSDLTLCQRTDDVTVATHSAIKRPSA